MPLVCVMNHCCDNQSADRTSGSMMGCVGLFLFIFLLVTSTAHPAQVTLEWDREDDSRVVGYKVYYGDSSGNFTDVADAGNETGYTVAGLEEGKTYYLTVTAYDAAGSESGPSGEVEYTAGVSSDGAGQTSGSGGGGGDCFIAIAAFGSPLAPEVQTLRAFRDGYLLTNVAGRTFVRVYYAVSPALADRIRQHEALRAIARALLVPLIYGAKHPQAIPAVMCSVLILAGLAFRRALSRGKCAGWRRERKDLQIVGKRRKIEHSATFSDERNLPKTGLHNKLD